jgi:prolipoprotein diacylglyceryltransferase
MLQVLFRIPIYTDWSPDGVPIYGFGMMLFLAFLLCVWLAGRRGDKVGISRELIQDVAIWVFVGGLIGARVTYLLLDRNSPVRTVGDFFVQLPRIWDGGIILYGSVVGGTAAYFLGWWVSFRKRGVDTLKLADVVAPSIALGVCLGRLGCFLNGCCYGQVVSADCQGACPVHFPLSAPARQTLVENGLQTAAGFTLLPPSRIGKEEEGKAVIEAVEPNSVAWNAGLRPGQVLEAVDGQSLAPDRNKAGEISRSGSEKLTSYLVYNWPKGKNNLELKVEGRDELIRYTPRTLGLHPTQVYESISMFLLVLLLVAYTPYKSRDGQVMGLLMVCYAVHRYLNELLRADDRPTGFEAYGSLILLAAGVAFLVWLAFRQRQYQPQWTT